MMRIWTRNNRQQKWAEIENGPFPITEKQLTCARDDFRQEVEDAEHRPLWGARLCPQTTARDILLKRCPGLADFDYICLGFAVTTRLIKFEVVDA